MNARVFSSKWRIALIGVVAALSMPGAVMAQHAGGGGGMHGGGSMNGGGMHSGGSMSSGGGTHGGGGVHGGGGMHGGGDMHGGGGFHGGGGGFHNGPPGSGGFHGSHLHDPGFHGPGFHDGFHGGFHGGFHDGFHGHRFHNGFFRPRFFGGFALGAFVVSLPLYYDTYWWGGVPYYYYDDTYFRWDSDTQLYQVVTPPSAVATEASQAHAMDQGTELFAYPMKGQTADQQLTDRYECHKWAVTQSGYDPTAGAAADDTKRDDYQRAEAACLEGRGYSVD